MMPLIKGERVILGGVEIVDNVLIGEPDGIARRYTLGIPKKDAHVWTDAIVTCRGALYRTLGIPEEGTEANIPLMWNKKVRIEQLPANGCCTVFDSETLEPHVFHHVFIRDDRGTAVYKTGEQEKGTMSIQIFGCCHKDDYRPKAGDIVVPHECAYSFGSGERARSEMMAYFRKNHPDYAVIKDVKTEIKGAYVPDYSIESR